MERKEHLDAILPLMRFFAEILGTNTEVVLYDVEDRVVYQVLNPLDDEMVPGSEMRSLERTFLESRIYEKEEFIVDYRAVSRSKHKLKSATFFLRNNPEKKLQGMITVNVNVERLVELRDILNVMISGSHPYEVETGVPFYNSFEVSVEGLVTNTIQEELDRFGVEPPRLSYQEKMEVVRTLDEKGIFLVKGAIAELAAALKTTETSIYRYLSKLQEQSP